ncbi:hypothetical protein [Leifsonia poae]|uniref:Uncharacterized protein n=1 Tax=Leifsonia poae TaxID=110933 RepID=A0A9W6M0V3_9MICO|nr:hypothetical protein [Leifsonia poae]GLJ77117.1 hypothetical protein GCM10017584_26910 [Leifsonia poae]
MSLFKRHPKHDDGHSRDDDVAVERYEYLLATAQPDMITKMHLEAFAKLSDEQRDVVFQRFVDHAATPDDRPIDATPATLARVATDAETRRPGSLLRILGPQGADGSGDNVLLATISGLIVASPLAAALFPYDYGAGTGLWSEDADDSFDY